MSSDAAVRLLLSDMSTYSEKHGKKPARVQMNWDLYKTLLCSDEGRKLMSADVTMVLDVPIDIDPRVDDMFYLYWE